MNCTTPPILKLIWLFLLVLLAGFKQSTFAQTNDFRFKISGQLTDRLDNKTRLTFWAPSSKSISTFTLSDVPIKLPYETFAEHHWIVEFADKDKKPLFSVALSRDLFDEPRLINVKLDAPKPSIKPLFNFTRDIKYSAGITRRMQYRDLPFQDPKSKKLVRSKPLVMKITASSTDKVIHHEELEEGCFGSKWFAFIAPEKKLVDGETYLLSVQYDSGGLFPAQTTTRKFTYHRDLHGR